MTKRQTMVEVKEREGWLVSDEASHLYDLARSAEHPILEIGSPSAARILRDGSAAGHNVPVLPAVPTGLIGLLVIHHANPVAIGPILDAHMDRLVPGGVLAIHRAAEPQTQAAIQTWFNIDKRHQAYIRRGMTHNLAIIAKRVLREKCMVFLALPGPGIGFPTVESVLCLTESLHDVQVANQAVGTFGFQLLYTQALNAYANGLATHFAMLHSDVQPQGQWMDTLLDDLFRYDLDMVSVPCAIKDDRGVASCGIGDPADPWIPHRRWTMKELQEFPEIITAENGGYPEPNRYLLHNNACFVLDLRRPCWTKTDDKGVLLATHQFPSKTWKEVKDGKECWFCRGESEDWYFSRTAWEAGAKTALTRRVRMTHFGTTAFSNWAPWGKYVVDEDTRVNWGKATEPVGVAAV